MMFKSHRETEREAHELTGFDPYDGEDYADLSSTHQKWPFQYPERGAIHRKTSNCLDYGYGDASTKGVRRLLTDDDENYHLCGNCCQGFVIDEERKIVFTGTGRTVVL